MGVAHRGGAAYGPNLGLENTQAAFERAVELGFRVLETDVRRTADGVLVAVHDARLDRVSDGTGAIADLDVMRVRQAQIGGREPVPVFADVLAAAPHAVFVIDLKAVGTPAALARELRATGAENRACVGSFSSRRLWTFRLITRGRVATSAGPLGVAWLRGAPAWVTRWVHSPGVAYQVPITHRLLGREFIVVTAAFVAAAHRIGAQVHVWTVDDAGTMQRLLDLGVDGIIADRIDVLAQVLGARGAWPPR